MRGSLVLRSKRRVEVVPVTVDFSDEMLTGETIDKALVYVAVAQGSDATPIDLLEDAAIVTDTTIKQLLARGVVGVVYSVVFQATLTSGRILERTMLQAVLIDSMPAGPLYTQFYFTTPPYPVYALDGIGVSQTPQESSIYYWTIEGLSIAFTPRPSTLRDILRIYDDAKAEGLAVTFEPRTSTLDDILIIYDDAKPEGLLIAFEPRASTLRNILIQYTNAKPEGIAVSFEPRSGTLI